MLRFLVFYRAGRVVIGLLVASLCRKVVEGEPVSLYPVWGAGRGGWVQCCCCHVTNVQYGLKPKLLQLLLRGAVCLESWSEPITEIKKFSNAQEGALLLQSIKSFDRDCSCILRNGTLSSSVLLLCNSCWWSCVMCTCLPVFWAFR